MCLKKFKQSAQCWIRYGLFRLVSATDVEGARKVLVQALQSLPRRKRACAVGCEGGECFGSAHTYAVVCVCVGLLLSLWSGRVPCDVDLPVISKFAQMEFKHGSPERGRTVGGG